MPREQAGAEQFVPFGKKLPFNDGIAMEDAERMCRLQQDAVLLMGLSIVLDCVEQGFSNWRGIRTEHV
jgi:hypothetical protein